ncbi:MAG TPA: S8/S53 family peptidase [Cryomorphaceae bacterium]|nr:S8/S53 family peptidase [Cryomorphaceae bacterium]
MKYLVFPFLFFAFLLQAQNRENFNIELRSVLKTTDPTEELHLYIRGDLSEIAAYVRENEGVVKGVVGNIASVRIPAGKMEALRTAEFIDFIEFSLSKPQMLADVMITNNNIHPIHAGAEPLPQAYLGEDVVIGIIDSGLELDHPDFQNEDGSTRVIALWDHTQDENDPFRVPEPYGYGQEWNAEDINQDIDGHDDQAQWFGHGSTVGGVAFGNANATGEFIGVAPLADIIVVSSDFSLPNWKTTIADAVDYIFSKADELGKPAVVNASLGDYYGSHDGLDGAALFIDELLEEQSGRVMVSAAGNSNNLVPYHLAYDIPEVDTAFTWFSYNPASVLGEPSVFFELWADSADFYETSYTIGVDLAEPSYSFQGYAQWRTVETNLGGSIIDTIFQNGNILGIVETFCGQRGDQYQIQVSVKEAFSDQYKFRFSTTGGGTFDVWSYGPFGTSIIESQSLPGIGEFPDMIHYQLPDKFKTIVDSWTCSDKVITVANYVNRDQYVNYLGEITTIPGTTPLDISINSSQGPTRDDRLKPDITATGDLILSAGRLATLASLIAGNPDRVAEGGWHYRNGGTSMASPVVAGVAALFLERDPEANYADIKSAILENALADEFTGELPNLRWGYGKLNGFATLTEPFGVTSSELMASKGGIKIYPNPTRGELNILNQEGDLRTLDLYDLSGRLIKSINLGGNSGETISLSLGDIADGVYILQAFQENGQLLQSKLMIEK